MKPPNNISLVSSEFQHESPVSHEGQSLKLKMVIIFCCQPSGKHFRQLFLLKRLGNEIVHSGLNTLLSISLHGCSCHGNDGNARILRLRSFLTNDLRGLETVHLRHVAVHQYQIVRNGLQRTDCLLTVGRHISRKSHLFQHSLGYFLVYGIVLRHQDAYLVLCRFQK